MASSPIRPDQAVLNVSYNSTNVSQQCSVYDAQMQNSIGSWQVGDLRLLVTGVTTSNYPVVIVYDSKNYNYTIPAGGTSYTVTLDEITPFVSYRDKINIGGVEADLHDARISSIDSTPTSGSTNLVTSGGVKTALNAKQDTLVSGTNIKTINNESILGSGNITIQGGVTDVTVGGTSVVSNGVAAIDSESVSEVGIDTAVTQNSNNLITSGGVYTAIQNASGGRDFRLIASGTVATDATEILITQDSNGNALALTEVMIYAKVYGNSLGYASWVKFKGFCQTGSQQGGELCKQFVANSSYWTVLCRFRRVGDYLLPVYAWRSLNNSSMKDSLCSIGNMYLVESLSAVSGNITRVSLGGYDPGGIGAGTTYEIYGIDA